MASGKRSAWKRRVREFRNYLLCLVLGGIFLFMGLTQPIYTEENTMEIYADSEKALMSSQECRLYPIPLLICTDGTEYTFGFSCYKKIPSDFNSTPHSIRICIYTGYNWRPWDTTPEIAELESDGKLCFSLRDSNRERKNSRVTLVSIGAVFTGISMLCVGCEISLSPAVQEYFRKKKRRARQKQRLQNTTDGQAAVRLTNTTSDKKEKYQ